MCWTTLTSALCILTFVLTIPLNLPLPKSPDDLITKSNGISCPLLASPLCSIWPCWHYSLAPHFWLLLLRLLKVLLPITNKRWQTYLLHLSPLLTHMPYCPTWLHLQNTSSKINILRSARWWQQSIIPREGLFWVWGPVGCTGQLPLKLALKASLEARRQRV